MSKVVVTRDGAVLVVTINRPEARNAIDVVVAEQIGSALAELDADPALRVGVITGAGSMFCAGMDLKAFLRGEMPTLPDPRFTWLTHQPPAKPLIAAVEGAAVGGGFEIVLACDLIVAAQGARFGLPEVKRGLMAGGGGLLRLPTRVPRSIAMEWVFTGEPVGAAEAHRVGLVNRVVADGEALSAALELAGSIATNGPLAVAGSKQIILDSVDWPAGDAFERQLPTINAVHSSADAREGATAFVERRTPRWQGR